MSLQRTRPVNALQHVMNSFKTFEKKIDKLQNDVDYHGETLNDLRSMVNNLSLNTVCNPDGKFDVTKPSIKKNTAIQYENKTHVGQPSYNCKRKNSIQPSPIKIKSKIVRAEKSENKSSFATTNANNIQGIPRKRSPRPRKAEAPRKANILQNQTVIAKKRSKLTTQ